MKHIGRVLRSRSGTTLAEMLISLAILAILFTAIVAGVNSAVHVYRRSITASDAQTLTSTIVDALSGELRYADNVRVNAGTVVFDSDTFGSDVSVASSTDGRRVVISNASNSYELLSDSAYTSGLTASANVSYSGGVFTLVVKVSGSLISTRETTVTIRPLNL